MTSFQCIPRWRSNRFAERVLAQSALQILILSDVRRARVLTALLAEAARLNVSGSLQALV
jgi:hypothetical protein